MEGNQRRYRRRAVVEKEAREANELYSNTGLTKQEIRKLLTERRNIIGPNGESIYIPKHMAVNDLIRVISEEYGLSTAEISGVLVTLKHLSKDPEFCGKVNRVMASGIDKPLRIVRPETAIDDKSEEHIEESPIPNLETKEAPVTAQNDENIIVFPSQTNNARPANNVIKTYKVIDEEEYRRRAAAINEARAERYREQAEQDRKAEEERRIQNENLERQLAEHYEEQRNIKAADKRIGLRVACILAALWSIGAIGNLVNSFKQVTTPEPTLTPLEIHEKVDGKLFNVSADTISAFAAEVTPLTYYQSTPTATPIVTPKVDDGVKYESFEVVEPTISSVSENLNPNTNLYGVLQKYSKNSTEPVSVGGIASYEDFEELLESDGDLLYTAGPAYFANFSRQVVRGMLKDKYNVDKVSATYEKKGENDQIYEFYIRYYRGSQGTESSMEGRVDMTRNAEGRLETDEFHTLPMGVYEVLAMVGEFSDYSNSTQNPVFDIQGYANKYTGGNVDLAKQNLKDRMTFGTECIKEIIEDRVRQQQVDKYLGPEWSL